MRIDCSSLTSESTKISSLIDEVSNFEETSLAPIFFTVQPSQVFKPTKHSLTYFVSYLGSSKFQLSRDIVIKVENVFWWY